MSWCQTGKSTHCTLTSSLVPDKYKIWQRSKSSLGWHEKKKVQIHPLMSRIYKLYSIQMWAVLNANRNKNRRRNDISVGIRLNKNFFKKYLFSSNTENPKASLHAVSAFEPDFWVLLYKTISPRLVLKIHQNAED